MRGNITISRCTGGDLESKIHIELRDAKSRTEIVRLTINPEQFALAITGFGNQSCEILRVVRGRDLPLLGKKRETMSFYINVKNLTFCREAPREAFENALHMDDRFGPLYKQGWRLWDTGQGTQQKREYEGKWRVSLVRYVDPDQHECERDGEEVDRERCEQGDEE